MNHSDFKTGETFSCGGRRWRCTDVGSRIIAAVNLDDESLAEGPPYAGCELVFERGRHEGLYQVSATVIVVLTTEEEWCRWSDPIVPRVGELVHCAKGSGRVLTVVYSHQPPPLDTITNDSSVDVIVTLGGVVKR